MFVPLIDVTCPHCGARGQVMTPLPWAIIIGPCPECGEMVLLFCGRIFSLDTDIIRDGSRKQKIDHLKDVISGYLSGRIESLFEDSEPEPPGFDLPPECLTPHFDSNLMDEVPPPGSEPINDEEMDGFRAVDLKLIDNPEYFKAIFE